MTTVLGLDLSLTGCGVAGDGWADTIRFPARKTREDRTDYAHRRLNHITGTLVDKYLQRPYDLAVIERMAYGMHNVAMDKLAGLSWMVRQLLWQRNIPYALIGPTNLKLYAVGRGRRNKGGVDADGQSSKDATLRAVCGWFPWFDGDDNAADAAVLHAMGCDHLGAPTVRVPAANRAALTKCEWPELSLFNTAEVA